MPETKYLILEVFLFDFWDFKFLYIYVYIIIIFIKLFYKIFSKREKLYSLIIGNEKAKKNHEYIDNI